MTPIRMISATFLVLVFLVWGIGEAGLRIYQRVVNGTPLMSFLPGYKETRFPLSPFLVFGPRVDWQAPNKEFPQHAYFNHQGFRTKDTIGGKAPGEYRIITLGGSTTEDIWNKKGVHWPLVLQQELRSNGRPNVRVLNTAMSAYTTAHSLIRYQFDIAEHEPDMIIIMHNINDLLVNYYAAKQNKQVDPHYKVAYGLKQYTGEIGEEDIVISRLFHSIGLRLKEWQQAHAKPQVPDSDISLGRKYFKRNLANLIILARARNATPVLLTMPIAASERIFAATRRQGRPFPRHARFLEDFASYNQAIEETGKELGVSVINMNRFLPNQESYFVDFVHYSTEGSEAFGKTLSPHIAALIKSRTANLSHTRK